MPTISFPKSCATPRLIASVARREILARFLTQSGPVTVREVRIATAGYANGSRRDWWSGKGPGKLIRGKFRREIQDLEWCSRRVVEIGRRRALAALRKQIEAVELPHFAAFMQRWQHLDERDRLDGPAGTATVVRQLYGIARPLVAWDRDYLRARVRAYDPTTLSRLPRPVSWYGW
jgi:ATP-dependent Lhr-like helicase